MDWGKLRSFHAAAEAGSLTLAGERLGMSQSAVSRQIAALEEQLGVSLFQRHARGLVLTDSGHTLYRSTQDMAAAAVSANAALRDQQETPQGELIVCAPVAFGSVWLVPRLGNFVRRHPDLHLDLRLDDQRQYDLLKLEAECAIQLWPGEKADLIQRRLGSVATNLYAAPEYLKAHGVPRAPEDLDRHRIIAYGDENSPLGEMSFASRVGRNGTPPRQATLRVNNVFAMMRAVDAGLGIADLPDYMAVTLPRLVRVLPDITGPAFELFFIYPSDLRRSKRVAAFRDFLTTETESLRRVPMRQGT
jgi:DNA-binding transcriptional LysR family regulator